MVVPKLPDRTARPLVHIPCPAARPQFCEKGGLTFIVAEGVAVENSEVELVCGV